MAPLTEGEKQRNRHRLVDYLGLELRLLETQLELREDPELMRLLGQRYPLDHQGRIIYPLPFRLPQQPGSDNPFFLPPPPVPTRENRQKPADGGFSGKPLGAKKPGFPPLRPGNGSAPSNTPVAPGRGNGFPLRGGKTKKN
jgi:hypothetical protein